MKTRSLIVILLLGSLTLQAQESRAIAAKATRATLFFRGAEMTHTASAVLVKGQNELCIEGLSPNIDPGSLKITATGGTLVSASEFSVDYLTEGKRPDVDIERLADSIDFYTLRLSLLAVEKQANDDFLTMLKTGTTKNVSGSEEGMDIDDLIKATEYYKTQVEQIGSRQIMLEAEQRRLNAHIARLKSQQSQISTRNTKASGVLRLVLMAPAPVTTQLAVSYFTPDASWSPYYDIDVASPEQPVTIAARSKVRQTTGFDWENVQLTLSTATPSNGKVAPLFDAWLLRQRPTVMIRGMSTAASAPMMQNSYAYGEFAEEQVQIDEVKVVAYGTSMNDHITAAGNDLSVTYAIDLPYTIPGNGREQNIDLTTRQVAAEYKYYCAPRLDERVYLLAEIADWQRLELLSGPANITYEGTYIGQSRIDASSTQEKLSLTLGTDARVSVRREVVRDFTSRRELGSNLTQTFAYRITLRNNRTAPISLVLKDQYPISTQKEIEVTLDRERTTPWTANKTDVGVITWEEELAAGALKEYTIGYSVRYPKGMSLNL